MILKTDVFKKNSKLLLDFYSKGVGSEYTEGIYFDFNTGYAYVSNYLEVKARIAFDFEVEEGEDISNFIISIRKFLNICQIVDEVHLDNDYVFTTDTGVFKLHYLKENLDSVVELFNKDIDYDIAFEINSDNFEKIQTALKYTLRRVDSRYQGLYIKDGYLFSMSDDIFQTTIDVPVEWEFTMYNEFVGYLSYLGESSTYYSGNAFDQLSNSDSSISIIVPKFEILVPPIREKEFIEKYDTLDILEIDMDEIGYSLKVIEPYFKSSNSHRIFIDISDSVVPITFRYEEEGETAEKKVEVIKKADTIVNDVIEIDGNSLAKAINILGGGLVKIQLGDKMLCVTTDREPSTKIIISYIN
jgi:hypothetical protein